MKNITNQLIEISKAGKGISKDLFGYLLGDMTDCANKAVEHYEEYFDDIVKGAEQYVDFKRVGDEETEKHRWFETTYASLCKIKELYGNEICKTVAESVIDNTFLYPYEMNRAAEHLKNGGLAEDFGDMIQEGKLDDDKWGFPKISDLTPENELIQYKTLIRAEQDRFKDDVIRLYELIGGTEVYNKLMEIAGVTKEAVEARRTCDVSYAQKNGISEEAASGALTGAFVMSTDYLKGTKEYESIMRLINSFEEESEDEEMEM